MILNNILERLSRINVFLKKTLGIVCALFMAALTLVVLWGVLTRYIYGEQPAFTEEFARMFLICLTFLGGAFAFADGSHIGLDYFVSKFSPSARRMSALIAVLASLVFVIGVLVIGGSFFIQTSMKSANMLVSAQVYLWQIYICIPICGAFSLMFLLESFLSIICGKVNFIPEKIDEDGGIL